MSNATRTAIISIFGSAVISAVISFAFQQWGDSIAHDRAARLQIALDFTSAPDNLIPIATRYIKAVSDGGDISPIQTELRSYLASEISRADHLKSEFGATGNAIQSYQRALQNLAQAIEQAVEPTRMRPWVEAFGRVVDAKQHLDATLKEAARA